MDLQLLVCGKLAVSDRQFVRESWMGFVNIFPPQPWSITVFVVNRIQCQHFLVRYLELCIAGVTFACKTVVFLSYICTYLNRISMCNILFSVGHQKVKICPVGVSDTLLFGKLDGIFLKIQEKLFLLKCLQFFLNSEFWDAYLIVSLLFSLSDNSCKHL